MRLQMLKGSENAPKNIPAPKFVCLDEIPESASENAKISKRQSDPEMAINKTIIRALTVIIYKSSAETKALIKAILKP